MKKYLDIIEERLSAFNFGSRPIELYEPIRYILSLGGKRLRPVLTLMACEVFDDQFDKAVYPALAVEVFHNFTLLHDDIMDNAPIRRGKQTVHEKWDTNIAILSGDVMLIRAYDLFLKSDHGNIRTILSKFNACAAEVCEGQQYDMNFESMDIVSESQYLEMIQLKTAVLLGFALELGAIIGGADEEARGLLYNFGINMGLGFQLKDDLLDVYADSAKFGKQVGGDIISNKKTYLLIKAIELAKNQTREDLDLWLKKKIFAPEKKVRAVLNIYNKLGVREICESKINEYFDKGLKILESIKVEESKKRALRELTLNLIHREK